MNYTNDFKEEAGRELARRNGYAFIELVQKWGSKRFARERDQFLPEYSKEKNIKTHLSNPNKTNSLIDKAFKDAIEYLEKKPNTTITKLCSKFDVKNTYFSVATKIGLLKNEGDLRNPNYKIILNGKTAEAALNEIREFMKHKQRNARIREVSRIENGF